MAFSVSMVSDLGRAPTFKGGVYQEALETLDSRSEKKGNPSDHKIGKVMPVYSFNNQNSRVTEKLDVQP